MTFNCLIEKYKILHSEENLINDYLYQNPEKLKSQNYIKKINTSKISNLINQALKKFYMNFSIYLYINFL